MRLVAEVDTGLGGRLLATHWASPTRLLAVVGKTLVAIDTGRRRVVRTEVNGTASRRLG